MNSRDPSWPRSRIGIYGSTVGLTTHDYRRRFWAHDFTFDPIDAGQRGHMMGWGPDIVPGDFLILEAPNPNGSRYAIERISYFPDPPDMWEADVVFAPR